jgi:hypothetical protein
MEISAGLRCDSKKCKALQKSHKVPQAHRSSEAANGDRLGQTHVSRLIVGERTQSSGDASRMFTSQHQATGAKHLESVLAIVCVMERIEPHRRGPSSAGFSALSPGRDTGGARDSRHHRGLKWPKRTAHTEATPQQRAEPPTAAPLAARTDITPPVPRRWAFRQYPGNAA